MRDEQDAYDRLCAYTLTRGDPDFIHQHVVDAWAAQTADGNSRPIGVLFALVGLYLHLEHGYSGRRVQQAHMLLARRKVPWPRFPLPEERGSLTARQVMEFPEGPRRDRAIHEWCAAVWDAYRGCHRAVAEWVRGSSSIPTDPPPPDPPSGPRDRRR